jgi:hypothetical protein
MSQGSKGCTRCGGSRKGRRSELCKGCDDALDAVEAVVEAHVAPLTEPRADTADSIAELRKEIRRLKAENAVLRGEKAYFTYDEAVGLEPWVSPEERILESKLAESRADVERLEHENATLRGASAPAGRYFAYSESCGFETWDTPEQAKASALASIEGYQDEAGDGWPDAVHGVCWGPISEWAVENVLGTAPAGSPFDYISEFKLEPTRPLGTSFAPPEDLLTGPPPPPAPPENPPTCTSSAPLEDLPPGWGRVPCPWWGHEMMAVIGVLDCVRHDRTQRYAVKFACLSGSLQ